MNCPICKKPVEEANPEAPFCSARCRTIDLGNWATGAYVIPVPLPDEDEDAEKGGPEGEK